MAGKADFTEAEWDDLHLGLTGAGMLVAVSDAGFFDSFKEAGTLAKHLAAAGESSPSELIRELAGTHGTGFGMTARPAEVEAKTVAALESAAAVLQAKAPDDLDAYRRLVVDLATSVSGAAGGGDDAEAKAIAKVRAAVGA
jgi:uncharacterized heparinase superfamily protein